MIGFINLNKPEGYTSAKCVHLIKKTFKLKKIGHMGTLDPMACGVLPIAIGNATRMFNYFLEKQKTYIAAFKFGILTDTLDVTGNILENNNYVPNINEIAAVLKAFPKKYNQTPPLYSAKKVGGFKAYELARENINFKLNEKEVEIYEFCLIEQICNDEFKFKITCSSGTYIRSLANDFGKTLNTTAVLSYLQRTESGIFNINNSVTLENLLNSDIINNITEVSDVFPQIATIEIDDFEYNKLINGVAINKASDPLTFVKYKNNLIGLGKNNNTNLWLEVRF